MRVFVADDKPEVRSALRLLLEQDPETAVVGEADRADELVVQVGEVCPDLLLVDWELPGASMGEILPVLRCLCPRMFLVALSGQPDARERALAAGVDAFVSKGDPPERLLAALQTGQVRQGAQCQRTEGRLAR